jgi:hypothetical protein
VYVEPSLQPRDEVDLVMVNDLSHILLDSVCHYFIEIFVSDRMQGYFSFLTFIEACFVP